MKIILHDGILKKMRTSGLKMHDSIHILLTVSKLVKSMKTSFNSTKKRIECIGIEKTRERKQKDAHFWDTSLFLLATFIILSICITAPVLAGTKYLSGSPNLSVSIDGNNEFTPGTTVPIKLQIQNYGLNQIKFVQSGIVDTDDNPNTAKLVKVSLLSGDSPILIKSDPQMIGDIKGSQTLPVSFQVRIPDDAKAGTYSLPVLLDYTYLGNSEQDGTDSIVYRYVKKQLNYNLPFVIKSAINLEVLDEIGDNISAGGMGFVTLTLKNNGTNSGENAIAKLSKSGNSPIIPIDGNVYLGNFAPGKIIDAKFKVSVSKDAEPQKYPVSLLVNYKNKDGETIDSPSEEIGIPVGEKVDFSITSPPPTVHPGEEQAISVTYRNDGSIPIRSAEVRLSAVDPFTSNDDLAYLGDLKPGESAVARFMISADREAIVKDYGLDSEVKYRDALDDSQISDTVTVQISVTQPEGFAALLGNPVMIIIILLVIIGVGYYGYNNRKNRLLR